MGRTDVLIHSAATQVVQPGSVLTSVTIPTPSVSAGAFPDATSTGPAPGTTFTIVPDQATSGPGWTWVEATGGIEVRDVDDGTIISGLHVKGVIDCYSGVTVQDCIVEVGGDVYGVTIRGGSTHVGKVLRCLIGPPTGGTRLGAGVKDISGLNTIEVANCNMYRLSTGIQLQQGSAHDNYIHDIEAASGGSDHCNCITTNGGNSAPVLIQHNTCLNPVDQACAIAAFEDFGTVTDCTIDDNYCAGGSYVIYGGSALDSVGVNIVITNNQISTVYFANGGTFGPVANAKPANGVVTFTGNVWADGPNAGVVITP